MAEIEDDFEDQESEESEQEEPSQAPSPVSDKDLEKLRKENRSLRSRLRRSEIAAKHGEDVADLIPDVLPLKQWDEYAEKLSAKITTERAQPEAEDEATQEKAQEAPSEQETKLAALNEGSSGKKDVLGPLSYGEFKNLYRENPQEALRLAETRGMAKPGEIGT